VTVNQDIVEMDLLVEIGGPYDKMKIFRKSQNQYLVILVLYVLLLHFSLFNCKRCLSNTKLSVTDVDECNRNNGGCDISATCINVPGSVRCVCDDGYTGDDYRCRG